MRLPLVAVFEKPYSPMSHSVISPSGKRFRSRAEIARYLKQAQAIAQLPSVANKGWLRVDSKPVKQALATWVTKWVFLFTQYLSNKLTDSMRELYAFRAAGVFFVASSLISVAKALASSDSLLKPSRALRNNF